MQKSILTYLNSLTKNIDLWYNNYTTNTALQYRIENNYFT